MVTQAINIIFDGPPGPEAGRFVEVETDNGESIRVGEWKELVGGLWALRITQLPYKLDVANGLAATKAANGV